MKDIINMVALIFLNIVLATEVFTADVFASEDAKKFLNNLKKSVTQKQNTKKQTIITDFYKKLKDEKGEVEGNLTTTNNGVSVIAFKENHISIPSLKWRGEMLTPFINDLIKDGKEVHIVHEALDDSHIKSYSKNSKEKKDFLEKYMYLKMDNLTKDVLEKLHINTWEPKEIQKKKNKLHDIITNYHQKSCNLVKQTEKRKVDYDEDELKSECKKIEHGINDCSKELDCFALDTKITNKRNSTLVEYVGEKLQNERGKIFILIAGADHLNSIKNDHLKKLSGKDGWVVVTPANLNQEITTSNLKNEQNENKEDWYSHIINTLENLDIVYKILNKNSNTCDSKEY
ncbi:MAG: hypothetical protein HQK49_03975 [Oligoflexia bacterium]|nr:hypothetical protein [Oligoflexia bacterium]